MPDVQVPAPPPPPPEETTQPDGPRVQEGAKRTAARGQQKGRGLMSLRIPLQIDAGPVGSNGSGVNLPT